VLKAIALILRQGSAGCGDVGRWGGEEFLLCAVIWDARTRSGWLNRSGLMSKALRFEVPNSA
jgi:GGDEF domain-containing protein